MYIYHLCDCGFIIVCILYYCCIRLCACLCIIQLLVWLGRLVFWILDQIRSFKKWMSVNIGFVYHSYIWYYCVSGLYHMFGLLGCMGEYYIGWLVFNASRYTFYVSLCTFYIFNEQYICFGQNSLQKITSCHC